jgi:formylglycine-generating enzyme required for sulfatase activity
MSLRLFKSCALTLMLMVTFAVLSSPAIGQESVSQTCAKLGFKPGSRGHTDCVNQNSGVGGRVAPKPANPAPAAKAPVVPELTTAQREDKFWEDAKAIGNKEAFEAYLERYPNGLQVGLAKANIARLSPANIPPPVPANNRPPGTTFKDCPDCPEMVMIPAGRFVMGAAVGEEESEKLPENLRNRSQPQHGVDVASFSAGKFEITRGQYRAFADATGRSSTDGCFVWTGAKFEKDQSKDWRNPGYTQDDPHPVACVSWDDAKAYTVWLSQKAGQEYRLLSEAEWEYAARAGTTGRRSWGDDGDQSCGYANGADQATKAQVPGWKFLIANCNDRYAYTAPVGSYRANAFGLYDMLGNVWEWTEDCWNENYTNAPTDGSVWTTGNCSRRVVRGGSWYLNPQYLHSAGRGRNPAALRLNGGGFRVARTN